MGSIQVSRDRTLDILLLLLALTAIYPAAARNFGVAPRALLIILLWFLIVVLFPSARTVASGGSAYRRPGFSADGFLIGFFIVIFGQIIALIFGSGSAVAYSNLQRFLVSFPLAAIVGLLVASRRETRAALSSVLIYVLSVTGLLATIEHFRGASLFGRDSEFGWLVRDNAARAFLASEHPLVLGATLAIGLPFAALRLRGLPRVLSCCAIVAGIWATGSRGSLLVTAVIGLVVLFPGAMRTVRVRPQAIACLFLILLMVVGYFALVRWTPVTTSLDWSENSLQYRAAIYSLLPLILLSAPFGYGLGDLPAGQWHISAPNRYLDLTHSVDSQFVLSALRAGWIGIGALILVSCLAVLATRRDPAFGLAGFGAALSSFFVAVDAWDAFGVLWLVIIFANIGLVFERSFARKSIGNTDHIIPSATS